MPAAFKAAGLWRSRMKVLLTSRRCNKKRPGWVSHHQARRGFINTQVDNNTKSKPTQFVLDLGIILGYPQCSLGTQSPQYIVLTSRRWNKKGPGRVPHQARRGFIKIGCLVAVTVIGAFDQPQRSVVIGVVIVVLHCVRSFHQISLRLTSCLKTKNIYSYICIT